MKVLIVPLLIALVCGGAGFGLGGFLSRGSEKKGSSTEQTGKSTPDVQTKKTKNMENWYYEVDPVIANLDEPGVTRYVRAALTLEISSEWPKEKGIAYLTEKNPLLTNWLTIYLGSLSVDEVRGGKNQMRIQAEILDSFNRELFPDSKPKIEKILLKEFVIQ